MLNKKSVRVISVLLSVMMCTSAFAGCSSAQTQETSGTSSEEQVSGQTSSADAETSEENILPRSEERRTLKIELYDRGITDGDATADNNYTTDFIRESFGEYANADIEFVLVPRAEEVDKLNVMMAAKSAPDICFTYDRDLVFQYATQGGLTELDGYYEKCPGLQKKLGENIKYGKCNDKIIAIPGLRKHPAQHVTVIRQDWLDKVGLEPPETRDEWYQAMKTFKEEDPGNLGEKNYPFLLLPSGSEVNAILWSFVDPDLTEEEDFTLPWLMLPGWKDGMQFLNQMYNEGLINPEFGLDQNKTMWKQAVSTGAWGSARSLTSGLITSDEVKTMYKNIPESDVTVIDPFENAAGEHLKNIYPEFSLYNIIPASSSVPDLAMQYLEWLSQPDVATRLLSGIEGIHWEYNDEGLRISIPDAERPEEWRGKRAWSGTDFYILDAHPESTYEDEAYLRVFNAQNNYLTIDKQPDLERAAEVAKDYQASMDNSLVDGFVDVREIPLYEKPLESVSKYQINLDKIYNDGFVKIVTAPADQFETVYQQVLDQYLKSGGQQIIDEKAEYYKELNP